MFKYIFYLISLPFIKYVNISIGRGNTMVEFLSAEMEFRVWNMIHFVADYEVLNKNSSAEL